jgi:biotin operon repressor
VSTTNKQWFAPIPLRAVLDQRLTGHHWRVLALVAAHDRLGKNGSGCWASQDRLAAFLGCSKSRLSEGLSDLRDYGYISSQLNPQKRWYRVHRVIYSSDDERFWAFESVPQERNSPTKSVPESRANQFHPTQKMSSGNSGLQNVTIVRTIQSKNKEISTGRNCAKARSRPTIGIEQAATYLTNCEAALADAATRDSLILERPIIAELADDASLPEPVNERAAKLLARIPKGNGEM